MNETEVKETEMKIEDQFKNNGWTVIKPGVVEVTTSVGVWTIAKPKAGVRNRALAKAETSNGGFKKTTLFMDLIPKCIRKRPEDLDDTININHLLDGLEIEDYDELFEALFHLITPATTDEISDKKKT